MQHQPLLSYCLQRLKTDDWSQWPASDDDELQSTKLKFLNSTLYFTYAALPEEVKVRTGDNSYRLCFAFHSSLSEVWFEFYMCKLNLHAWPQEMKIIWKARKFISIFFFSKYYSSFCLKPFVGKMSELAKYSQRFTPCFPPYHPASTHGCSAF